MNELQDERENVVLMTGAIYALLLMTDRFEAVRIVEGDGVPSLEVEIDFMMSPYRLTLERVDEPKQGPS